MKFPLVKRVRSLPSDAVPEFVRLYVRRVSSSPRAEMHGDLVGYRAVLTIRIAMLKLRMQALSAMPRMMIFRLPTPPT